MCNHRPAITRATLYRGMAAAITLALLAGCGTAFPAVDGKTRVIASAYPFAWIAQEIGGAHIELRNLTPAGSEPHDVELTPHQVAAVQDTDVMVYERGFQPSVDNAVDQAGRSSASTVDVASTVSMRRHGGSDHGALDPHVWLDPNRMITIADAVTARLIDADPEHAEAYRARSERVIDELRRLDSDLRAGLTHCQRSIVVTSHAAFGYLTDRYGLQQASVAGLDPNNEPTPTQLEKMTRLIRRHSIVTVFTETRATNAVAETIAAETGADVATLNPIETATLKTSYIDLMRKNLSALHKANGCT